MTEEQELTEKEVEITAESLALSIKELCVDATKSDRNRRLPNTHAATLREYALQERVLTNNYGVERKSND